MAHNVPPNEHIGGDILHPLLPPVVEFQTQSGRYNASSLRQRASRAVHCCGSPVWHAVCVCPSDTRHSLAAVYVVAAGHAISFSAPM